MSDPKRPSDERWSLQNLTQPGRDLRDAPFEMRERGPEAEERDRLYIQNAFATLAPRGEVVRWGAVAGFQVGLWCVAVMGLLVLLGAASTIGDGPSATLYGATPLVGTIFEPLWPLVLSLVALPVLAVVGGLAALALRAENRRRGALASYFNPVRTWTDLLVFVVLIGALLRIAVEALGMTSAESDQIGLVVLALAFGGIIGWPAHSAWLKRFLADIRKHGSASLPEIVDGIRRQI